jgi:hypothetical protein
MAWQKFSVETEITEEEKGCPYMDNAKHIIFVISETLTLKVI